MYECVQEMSKCYEKDEFERMRGRSYVALAKVSKRLAKQQGINKLKFSLFLLFFFSSVEAESRAFLS